MDQYTEVSYRSLGSNLLESIGGMLLGILLFLIAFPVLWWNEGRTDASAVARMAVPVRSDGSDKSVGEGKLVAVTGELSSRGAVGDPHFLQPGPYVALDREVEMYAWVEEESTEEQKQIGGGTKVIKKYTYKKEWTSDPKSGEGFRYPEDHRNPPLPIRAGSWKARRASVGVYGFDPKDIELPPGRTLALDDHKLKPSPGRMEGNYVFVGRGGLANPAVGDVRAHWIAVEGGRRVTAYGRQEGTRLVPYRYKGEESFYRVVDGSPDEAIATLRAEHRRLTWILRGIGFLLMWVGLTLVLGPINTVLDILPFVGSVGRALTGIVLLPVALVLTGVTIMLSTVAHNPVLLGVLVLALVAGSALLIAREAAQKKAA